LEQSGGSGLQEAFRSHPRIGETKALNASHQSATWSRRGAAGGRGCQRVRETRSRRRQSRVREQFGRIFIVCATGKSPEEILTIFRRRLENDHGTELRETVEQQRQITQLRLRKWLQSKPMKRRPDMKRISTHVLDIARGGPRKIFRASERQETTGWKLLSSARTDHDGRCAQLLPENEALIPGTYRIGFDTAAILIHIKFKGLYPEVEIMLYVRDGEHTFHIPLLLSQTAIRPTGEAETT